VTAANAVAPGDTITYREAIAEGIAREMRRDPAVVCLGEDIGAAEGVFKTTAGLFNEFGPERVWDTPISEQAILGVAIGSAMTGMRPVAEVMFSDFLACCWDYVANEAPKIRYMSGGQLTVPMVVRTANGGGLGFGAQHSQAVENWAFAVPGLKVVAPSSAEDVIGLMASAIRSDDPVVFFEHKSLFATKGTVPAPGHTVPLGEANVVRAGGDVTIVSLASTVPTAMEAAERAATEHGVSAEVIDLRCLVPLDASAVLQSVEKTSRLIIVEENPYQGGWGGTVASIVADEGFHFLDGPIKRVAGACLPLAFASELETAQLPTTDKVLAALAALLEW
jgi:pyruvate dehydrogenase E1 component beta subunit